MAIASIFRQISKAQNLNSAFLKVRNFSIVPSPQCPKPSINPFQGWPMCIPAETLVGFGETVLEPKGKYCMLNEKGEIGETSCSASLAVLFANHNHPTVGVSTYPTLPGGFFDQYWSGISLVPVQGKHSPLLPLEINFEKTKEDIQRATLTDDDSNAKDFMGKMGLGMLSQQLEEVRSGELLVTPPPGLCEALSTSEAYYTAAGSSVVDAVIEYTYFARRSAATIRCATKKIKFAKQRKGTMKGISHRGNCISFGSYALQVLEHAWITAKQLEAGRRALSRVVGRSAKIWVRVIPDKPVTAKPAETRMGRGKGSVSFHVAVVKPGRILYEISGVTEAIARKAVAVAASKLPVQTRFIITA